MRPRSRATHAAGLRRFYRVRSIGRSCAALVLVALISAASFFIIGQALIRPRFDRIAHDQVRTLLHDVKKRIDNEVSVVDAVALQNSNWTAMYDAMAHDARAFLAENEGDTAAQSAGISVVVIAYPNGTIAYENSYNWDAGRADAHLLIPATANLRRAPLWRNVFSGTTTTGVFTLGGRVAAVAARPIVRNNGSGRNHGIVLFARELDHRWQQAASDDLHATVSIAPVATGGPDRVSLGQEVMEGTAALFSSAGAPIATVQVRTAAVLEDPTEHAILNLVIFATLVMVAGGAALIWSVQRVARRQSDRFQSVVQNARDVIVLFNKRGAITYVSPSVGHVFGQRPNALVGTQIEEWVHPDDGFDPQFAAWRAPDSTGAELMLRFRRGDGTWALCEAHRADLLRERAVRSVVLNLHDITDRARASDEIVKARDEAVRAMNVKSQFLASMSHEIRTPLNGVLGLSELLLSTPLDSEQTQYATHAHSAAENLLAIVNDILDFSKVEAGKLEVEDGHLDPSAVVNEVVALLAPQAQAKGLEIESRIDPALATMLRGDPLRLRQVLLNLAANAVKFTDSGYVTVAAQTLAASGQSVSIHFEVIDTGIGIGAQDQVRIFGAFAQADSSVTRRYGGTGLGLAISRELVRAMGGELRVVSDVGSGSTFSFEIALPRIVDAPTVVHENVLHDDDDALAGRVLLVEDTEVNQLVATRMLARLGFEVDVAVDGADALDVLALNEYRLVFMDCQMPVMDGYEATRQLRRRERDSSAVPIPVIAMTAAAMAGDRERCLRAGMDDYISKPLTIAALRAVVARWTTPPVDVSSSAVESDVTAQEPRHSLDLSRIAELREVDPSDGLMERLIGSFLNGANEKIGRLREAVSEGNPEAVEFAAHALKGSSGNIGATVLAAHAEMLERLGHGRALGGASAVLVEIEAELERVAVALQDALKT